jgi:hypothetical protein
MLKKLINMGFCSLFVATLVPLACTMAKGILTRATDLESQHYSQDS